jgi:hypothetical protein
MIDKYQSLLGRPLSDSEKESLSQIAKTLDIRKNDALWQIIIALQYHLTLYKEIPKSIQDILDTHLKQINSVSSLGNIRPYNNTKYTDIFIIITLCLTVMAVFGSFCFFLGTQYKLSTKFRILDIPAGYIVSALCIFAGIAMILSATFTIASGRKGKNASIHLIAGLCFVSVSTVILFFTGTLL